MSETSTSLNFRNAVPASPQEASQRDRITYAEWGPPLDENQFLDREQRLRAHPWAQAQMRTWLLQDPASGRIGASCETFRMDSRFQGEAGTAHGIASVFTDPDLRGHGLASQLLAGVARQLSAQEPALQALILFSDVGEKIYGRLGYRPIPAFDWVWPAQVGPAAGVSRAQLSGLLLRAAPPCVFQVEPSLGQLDWHFERTEIYAGHLGRPEQLSFGLTAGGKLLAAWAAHWKENTLYVLFNRAETEAEIEQVQSAARAEAHRLGIPTVTQWEEANWVSREPARYGAQRQIRDGAIPMLLPIHAGSNALPPAAEAFTRTDRELTFRIWPQCPRALWV